MAKNRYVSSNQTKSTQRKWLVRLLIAILVVALVVAAVILLTHDKQDALHTPNTVRSTSKPAKTSASKSSGSIVAQKSPTSSNSSNTGSAVDTHGATTTTTSSKDWNTSKSGNITLKQPAANAILKSGATISGSAKVSQVLYRLIDNESGVLSQQQPISVVNGNFSATVTFTPHSGSGRLDVFSFDTDGSEINEVQVPVNF